MKMAVFQRVVIFIAVVIHFSESQNDFAKLPESYKKGVRLAEMQVNSHTSVQTHFLFFKSLAKSSIEVSILLYGVYLIFFFNHCI